MIDVKVTTLGGPEIARTLSDLTGEVRTVLEDELSRVGEEIVSVASRLAPKGKYGRLSKSIIWYLGQEMMRGPKGRKHLVPVNVQWKDKIRLTVRPRGRVAHLMERGVNATFQQKVGRGKNPTATYTRTNVIKPREFFWPAVQSVGGAAGVNARLQAALNLLIGQKRAA